ncbi:MAG: prephenate dehydrogenase/arogenate dehydrogenase family protein, partial [Clostridiales bacterium]|nr:prephenate dehydrogenase/arogenate dehydrogenase family protein [Clostridiales bacterium]
YNVRRFTTLREVGDFVPEMVINCVTLNHTLDAFNEVIPYLLGDDGRPRADCLICDIASVKTNLRDYYEKSGFRYVSVHPMFGPTFATLDNLQNENAVIIREPESASTHGSDMEGVNFFALLFSTLHLNICYYSFEEHDHVVAYSLSIPFASTLVFASVMKHQDAPGTTFKRHLAIAHGLLSEDDFLLTEIMFNPNTPAQLDGIIEKLQLLRKFSVEKDSAGMKSFLSEVRQRIR